MKHTPFQSIYREHFEVVEERHGHTSFFPHTDQLAALHRALQLEFLGPLPGHIARVDHRADGFQKFVHQQAAFYYCACINRARTDRLRLFDLPDYNLVARVCIVQQITAHEKLGRTHRFRFYGGEDFFPEIRISGKRVVFAEHVLQRFSTRTPNSLGEDLTNLLIVFFGGALISMMVGSSRAFMTACDGSVLAFTHRESAEEYFITTCLSIHEMNSLQPLPPPYAANLHYAETFIPPMLRTWQPGKWAHNYHDLWKKRAPFKLPKPPSNPAREHLLQDWHWAAVHIKDIALRQGHGPGTQRFFTDHIPGPILLEIKPGGKLVEYDEQRAYQPPDKFDLRAIYAECAAQPPAPTKPKPNAI